MKKDIVESSFIFSMYREVDLFHDYMDKVDAINFFEKEESIFYYTLGRELVKQGYKSIDQLAVATYLLDKPALNSYYEELGGWKTIKDITNIVNESNIEKYYDELVKNNVIKTLKSKGFVIDEAKFNGCTSQDVYAYYEFILNSAFVHNDMDIKIDKFNIDDAYLKRKDDGIALGASIGSTLPRLNYDISGLHSGNLSILASYSGNGKSSLCIHSVVLPLLEQGYKYTIISNEQVLDEFRDNIICLVMAKKFNYWGITRKRLQAGKFTEEEWKHLTMAKDYINSNYADKLNFVKMFEYNVSSTKKIIKKLANEGCKYFLYDTFKAEDASDSNVAGLMVEYSKELFQLASKMDIHILITQQLATYTENQRYLTRACLSNSKQVAEVADVIILMRHIWDDEFEGEQYDITPYNFMKDSNGNYVRDDKKTVKELVNLDRDERNIIIFLDKNRWGEDKKTYVCKFNGRYNIWNELGYCHVSTKNRY